MLSILKLYAEKFAKSEFFVTMVAMVSAGLSKKLGLPDEAIQSFILSVTGLAAAYIGGRSVVKSKEAVEAAKAELAGLLK